MSREVQVRFCERRGVRFPPPTLLVVLCTSQAQAGEASRVAAAILGGLGLELHPDKTRVVDLREGREGFDFLGCHLHARMSGRIWERRRETRLSAIERLGRHQGPDHDETSIANARVSRATRTRSLRVLIIVSVARTAPVAISPSSPCWTTSPVRSEP